MIRTERLLLRPFRADDLDALHAMYSDPQVMRYWDRPADGDPEKTRASLDGFLREAPDEHLEYAVERDGVLIGRVAMFRRYEIGYMFAPAHWGAGLATEALQALVAAAFARFPEADALTAEIDPRNTASARLLQRLGFVCTGTAEKNFLYGDTEWCDTAYYALSRDGWAGRT